MKLIYIAGPYRADSVYGVSRNIEAARSVAAEVWRLGACAVCPHLNSAYMDGLVPDAQFLDGAMEMMRRCDLVVLVPGYDKSAGAMAEWHTAEQLNIPTLWQMPHIAGWIEHSNVFDMSSPGIVSKVGDRVRLLDEPDIVGVVDVMGAFVKVDNEDDPEFRMLVDYRRLEIIS